MDNDDYDDTESNEGDGMDDREESEEDGGESDDDDDDDSSGSDGEEVDEITVERFIRTFHNGDYDAEFDNSLCFDRSVPITVRSTQASYNKPDNWRERNRIGLEGVKEQLQTCINSLAPDLSCSFNLDLRHNSRYDQRLLMDNEEPVVWNEEILDEYWNHLDAAIDQSAAAGNSHKSRRHTNRECRNEEGAPRCISCHLSERKCH